MQGHRYKGWCDVAWSLEFAMQCVRVCGEALEMFGGMQSLVSKVILILWHHPPSKMVSPGMDNWWGMGVEGWWWWNSQTMSGALARWSAGSHSLYYWSLATPWTLQGSADINNIPVLGIHYWLDLILFASIDKDWVGAWVEWVLQDVVWVVGADVGDGDDRVDSSLMGGEAEFDSGRGYDLFDHKGAEPFMIQLLGWTGGHVVLGIQPYLSSNFIGRCGAPLTIIVLCHLIHTACSRAAFTSSCIHLRHSLGKVISGFYSGTLWVLAWV